MLNYRILPEYFLSCKKGAILIQSKNNAKYITMVTKTFLDTFIIYGSDSVLLLKRLHFLVLATHFSLLVCSGSALFRARCRFDSTNSCVCGIFP